MNGRRRRLREAAGLGKRRAGGGATGGELGVEAREPELVLWGAELVLWAAELVLWGAELVLWGPELVLWGLKLVLWGAELVLWGAELVLWGAHDSRQRPRCSGTDLGREARS